MVCAFKLFFGFDCPGCGLIHSIGMLLSGRFAESVTTHPMGIVVVLWLTNFWWWRKLRFSQSTQKWIGCAILSGVFLPWILKLMTHVS